jgi:hypothetical protein
MFERLKLDRLLVELGVVVLSVGVSPWVTASYSIQLNLLRNTLSSMVSMVEAVDRIHEAVTKEIQQRGG